MMGRRGAHFESVAAAERVFNRRVPLKIQGFVRTGVGEQHTLRRNVSAFASYALKNQVLTDVSQVSTSTQLLGARYDLPVVLAPTGLQGIVWPEGELAMARAAKRSNAGLAASANAAFTLEDVAAAHGTGPRWMQMDLWNSPEVVESFVERAVAAKYSGLVVITGEREPATRHGDLLKVHARDLLDGVRRLPWGLQFALRRVNLANFAQYAPDASLRSTLEFSQGLINPASNWDDLRRLRELWPGHLIVKGIEQEADAHRAVNAGVDALIVSNTGGRGMDPSMASLDVLKVIRRAVADAVPVLVDGGIRSGSDIAVACCLGADAVLIGRPALWALASGGQAGVERLLEVLATELRTTMIGMGQATLESLTPDLVHQYPHAC